MGQTAGGAGPGSNESNGTAAAVGGRHRKAPLSRRTVTIYLLLRSGQSPFSAAVRGIAGQMRPKLISRLSSLSSPGFQQLTLP